MKNQNDSPRIKRAKSTAAGKIPFHKRIGFKLSLFSTLGILLVGIVSVVYLTNSSRALIDQANEERSQAALTTMESVLDTYKADSQKAATNLAEYDAVISAVESGDAAAVKAAANATSDYLGLNVDFITVTDSQGNVIARTHSDKAGDSVVNQTNISMALSGETTTHIDIGTEIQLSVRTGAPVKNASGKIIGVVSTGYSMVSDDFVDKMKSMTGDEFTIFVGDERANTTLMENGERITGTKMDSAIAKTVLEEGSVYLGEAELLGKPYAAAYEPIQDDNGNVIGAYFAGVPIAAITAALDRSTRSAIIIVLALMIIGTAVLTIFVRRFISKPVGAMAGAAAELSKGNLEVELQYKSGDELGFLSDALRTTILSLQGYIQDISDKLRQMASGNMCITIDHEYVGDFIAIKQAIEHIVATLNQTLIGINTAAEQVHSGAVMVSDSSVSLSQGATEQASSVEELTASLEEITSQTTHNAESAQTAAELTKDIKNDAEDGNTQMAEMLQAMNAISASSADIEKIIKVIEDIAFQTNILALNAAVEAARAGQYGKGFAVVAEEVRNLASKSAEAAKETTGLIEDSSKKVETGARIANVTAEKLKEIAKDTSKMAELVSAIASASNEQAAALEQINQGIMEVSQVVQNNAASSEESAAASEELSSQADSLKTSIKIFKLNSGDLSLKEIAISQEQEETGASNSLTKPTVSLPDNKFGKY